MNNHTENKIWNWQGEDYCHEGDTSIDMSSGVNRNETHQHLSYMLDETTPLKACGDLSYRTPFPEVTGKDLEQYKEPSSQVRRRKMLQFESEGFDVPFCNDEAFLRSKETRDSLEESISIAEMSQWVAGFAEDTSVFGNECLDPTFEVWIDDCLNDAEMHFASDDIDGASDVQIDITELYNTPEYITNAVKSHPVQTRRNVVFKAKKSYMRGPPKASSIVKPFDIIKPCGVHGDVTLKDINLKIRNPPKLKQKEDPSVCYPTSALTGKPVVGRTKIPTQGGKGSITIMRTKG